MILSSRSRMAQSFQVPLRPLIIAMALLAAAPLALASPRPRPLPQLPPLTAADASALIAVLRGASDQGFAPDEFPLGDAETALSSSDPAVRARGAAELEAAAIAYARAQHGGRLASRSFLKDWAIRPAPYDARADLATALTQHRIAAWAAGLPPQDPRYGRLLQVYARYRQITANGGWPMTPSGKALKLGATGPRVEALRRRLAVEDPTVALPPAPAPGAPLVPAVFDAALAQAVSRAQQRYGLTPDGAAGAATLRALNVTAEQRLGQIEANLERWRWAPRPLPAYRVELNIAAQTLELYDGDKPALGMKAVVGKPTDRTRTPMFQDRIEAVVLNPPWNVPHDIAVREIWPKIRKDRGYMAREGFVVRPNGELQQLPGPKCALGTIKFDLPNRFGVYMHDTPARSLFGQDSRAFSHGCMRLEQPNALAKRILKGTPGWSDDQIDFVILSGTTQRIVLAAPVPVFVFYWSVFVDDQGQVQFRPDLYGWDAKLLGLL